MFRPLLISMFLTSTALATSSEGDSSITTQVVQKAIASTIAERGSSTPVTTVITHGFQFGVGDSIPSDWCFGMGAAILERAGDNGSMYSYDPHTGDWNEVTNNGNTNGSIVLIFDWADESDWVVGAFINYADAAADALYTALRFPEGDLLGVELVSIDESQYLHFIGHSRGTSVNSEAARRLSIDGFAIDHMTSLDTHPLNGTMDNCLFFDPDQGDPTPQFWEGVRFFDNYFRQDSWDIGECGLCDADGLPLDCHHSCEIEESVLSGEGYCLEHSDIHLWYHGTIDTDINACDGFNETGECFDAGMRAKWYADICDQDSWTEQAYFWSRNGGGASDRPYDQNPPVVDPGEFPILFNGSFEGTGTNDTTLQASEAGWVNHGGEMYHANAQWGSKGPCALLTVHTFGDNVASFIVHNRFVIPEGAPTLSFNYMCTTYMSDSTDITIALSDEITGDPVFDITVEAFESETWLGAVIPLTGVTGGRSYRISFSIFDIAEPIEVGIDDVVIEVNQTDPTGACCVWESCTIETSDYCASLEGNYIGNDSSCSTETCWDADGVLHVPVEYSTIQIAVNAAVDGDEIIVAPGTYTSTADEVVNMHGKAVWLHSSGGQEVTFIDGEGTRRGILCDSGETNKTIIEGFTITNGYSSDNYGGGGMFNDSSSPTLENCTFESNIAGWHGGGMSNYNSSLTLTDCIFENNTADSWGGGMYNYESSPELSDCSFTNNTAAGVGGGMYNRYSSSPTLTNCAFTNNTANDRGGGMYNRYSSSPTLTECTFENNSAESSGGGMYNYDSSPALTNCTFENNTAELYGGGMHNRYSSSPTLTNCAFTNNTTWGDGGGMYNNESDPTLTDCTFTGNYAYSSGGGMYNSESSPALTTCTFTDNSADQYGGGGMYNYESDPTLTDCTFTGNFADVYNGGGIYNRNSSPTLENCTFTNNAAWAGGGMYNSNSSPALVSTIVCGNSPDQISPVDSYTDGGGNTIAEVCPIDCPADVNQDGVVDINDILVIIGAWGSSGPLGDINDDGTVEVNDLMQLIAAWGPCE